MITLYYALSVIGVVMLVSSLAGSSITEILIRSILGIAVLLLGIGLAIEKKREEGEQNGYGNTNQKGKT